MIVFKTYSTFKTKFYQTFNLFFSQVIIITARLTTIIFKGYSIRKLILKTLTSK